MPCGVFFFELSGFAVEPGKGIDIGLLPGSLTLPVGRGMNDFYCHKAKHSRIFNKVSCVEPGRPVLIMFYADEAIGKHRKVFPETKSLGLARVVF